MGRLLNFDCVLAVMWLMVVLYFYYSGKSVTIMAQVDVMAKVYTRSITRRTMYQ